MIQRFWAVSRRAWKFSEQAHGKRSDGSRQLKQHFRWAATAALRESGVREWFASLDSPQLRPFLDVSPRLAFHPLGTYMSVRWSWERRIKVIRDTYAFIQAQGGRLQEAALRREGMVLARFPTQRMGEVSIRLRRDDQFRKEGELGVFLETDQLPGYVSALAFSFEHLGEMGWACRVGAVQGRVGGGEDIIKEATKAMHGLRPKSLMVLLAQEIARAVRAKALFGVGNALHVFRSKELGPSRKVSFEYDELWAEAGGTALPDGWFQVPLKTARRGPDEIKPNKRSMYAKRYAWLDELSRQIRTVLTPF